MPLFHSIPIDVDEIRRLVDEHWSLHLDDCLRVSQNHTYRVTNKHGDPFILRVTPDPQHTRLETIELEVQLLDFLSAHHLPVCRAIPSALTSKSVVSHQSLHLCLFEHGRGERLNHTAWPWMTNREIVVGLGRWMARLHQLTRLFEREHPELARQGRDWRTLHDGVLAEVEVDEGDRAKESDPSAFGLIHGDIHAQNFFWDASLQLPMMFDWDEIQRSWFLYDLSTPIWNVIVLERTGSTIDRSPVREANSAVYTDWLIEGYEGENGGDKVDRAALARMVSIRRELYRRFCRRAVLELSADHPMASSCRFFNDFFDREEEKSERK